MASPLTDAQVQALPEADLAALLDQVQTERQRRVEEAHLPAMIADLSNRYTRGRGEPWPELTAAVAAYRARNNNTPGVTPAQKNL